MHNSKLSRKVVTEALILEGTYLESIELIEK
jgi:hypothetical protein